MCSLDESPYRSKLKTSDIKDFIASTVIATSTYTTDPATSQEVQCQPQHAAWSLVIFASRARLGALELSTGDKHVQQMVDIIRYTLVGFHLQCMSPTPATTHERKAFVERVVPVLRIMSKVTGLVSFSCGINLENVAHTNGDTIKLIECSAMVLKMEAAARKECSFDLMQQFKDICLHLVKNQLTMSTTGLVHPMYEHVQVRSARLPTTWQGRVLFVKIFELVATIIDILRSISNLADSMDLCDAGLLEFDGPTVRQNSGLLKTTSSTPSEYETLSQAVNFDGMQGCDETKDELEEWKQWK
ncbi:hypothetical protein BC940DRAFT_361512 [Gongronella butleri]|nr:hypothetical protein BC940DRAFT_361512 [Gongronella butleri]